MVGTKLQRADGAQFEITGQTASGGWVVQRTDEFESPREMSTAAIADEFSTEVGNVEQPDEQAGWDRLALASRAMANAQAAVSGELAEGDDLRVTFAGDRHEGRGTIRPPDIEGEQAEGKIKALRAAGRRLLRGEPSPEDAFRQAADREREAKRDAQVAEADAKAVAENAKRDPRPRRKRS